jgi:hypothetical protein
MDLEEDRIMDDDFLESFKSESDRISSKLQKNCNELHDVYTQTSKNMEKSSGFFNEFSKNLTKKS